MEKIKQIFICLMLLICSSHTFSQFLPGDVGYDPSIIKIYSANKIQFAYKVIDSTSDGYGWKGDTIAIFEFTEEGWLIRETLLPVYEEDDTIINEYTYFPDGRIRVITGFGNDLYPIETGFEYEKGKVSKVFHASAEAREINYEYDKKGNLLNISGKAAFPEFDDQGESTGEVSWSEIERNDYVWNEDGTLLNDRFTFMGVNDYIFSYQYNENKQLTIIDRHYVPEMKDVLVTEANSPEMRIIIEYDKRGLPLKTIQKNYLYDEYFEHSFLYGYFK